MKLLTLEILEEARLYHLQVQYKMRMWSHLFEFQGDNSKTLNQIWAIFEQRTGFDPTDHTHMQLVLLDGHINFVQET